MTGPEHYREAERLKAHAQELLVTGVYDAEASLQRAAAVLADAQVHATLAVECEAWWHRGCGTVLGA
jgi:hypothetical protein